MSMNIIYKILLTSQGIKWRGDGRMRQWRIRESQNSFGFDSDL